MIDIYICPVADVDIVWKTHADGFQDACDRSDDAGLTPGLLWQMCRSGFAFLVIGEEYGAVQFASVWRFEAPEKPTDFRCLALYGDRLERWITPIQEFTKEMAIDGGATKIVASGRKGWLRMVKNSVNNENDYEVRLSQ